MFPPAANENSCCSKPLSASGAVRAPDFGYPNGYVVKLHCCLFCIFLMIHHMEHLFFFITVIYYMSLLQKFSPSLYGSSSQPLDILTAEQKFLVLINYYFHDHAFDVLSKKSWPYPNHVVFLLLPSRSYIVFSFTFKSVIHSGLIFVKSVKSVSFFLLHVDVQLLNHHHLLKILSLLHCVAFVSLLKIN